MYDTKCNIRVIGKYHLENVCSNNETEPFGSFSPVSSFTFTVPITVFNLVALTDRRPISSKGNNNIGQ